MMMYVFNNLKFLKYKQHGTIDLFYDAQKDKAYFFHGCIKTLSKFINAGLKKNSTCFKNLKINFSENLLLWFFFINKHCFEKNGGKKI